MVWATAWLGSMRTSSYSLRVRIIVAFVALSVTLGVLFAGGIYVAAIYQEENLIDQTLSSELDFFVQNYSTNGVLAPPWSQNIRGYLSRPGIAAELPSYLSGLGPGSYELVDEGNEYHIAVKDHAGARFFLVYDADQFEERTRYMLLSLVGGVLVYAYVALWAGFWLSKKAIAPVVHLAHQVDQRDHTISPQPLASGYGNDEVGALAAAFDDYVARISAFAQRERDFAADASHELRTPLTIISGAVELLQNEADLSDKTRQRLQRVERACRRMSDTVGALLLLAKESGPAPYRDVPCAVEPVLRDIIDRHRDLLDGKPVTVRVDVRAPVTLPVLPAVLAIVIGNLVRNAFAYTACGEVRFCLEQGRLSIEDTGTGIAPDELRRIVDGDSRGRSMRGDGTGLGLSIVRRFCDRCGWRIEIASRPGHGTCTRLEFAPSPTSFST